MRTQQELTKEYEKQRTELAQLRNQAPPIFALDAAKHALEVAVKAATVNALSWMLH